MYVLVVIFKNSELTISKFFILRFSQFWSFISKISQAFIFLFALPLQACGTQNWPQWNGKIEWTKCKKENDGLRRSLKKVITDCENLRRKIQKRGISDFENHAEFRELDNEPFISSKLYGKLFPPITIQHPP